MSDEVLDLLYKGIAGEGMQYRAARTITTLRAHIAELEDFITSEEDTLDSCIIIMRDGGPPCFTVATDGDGTLRRIIPNLTRYVIIPIERYGEVIRDTSGVPINKGSER